MTEKSASSTKSEAIEKAVAFAIPMPRDSLLSNADGEMSASTPLTVNSIAYLTEGIEAFSVHPDFNGGGSVLVLCRSEDGGVGFRVSGFHLSAVSPTFKAALVGHLHTACTLHVADRADDMAAFLRLFKLAPSGAWAKFDPPMATYYRVLLLLEKYRCHDFMRAAFAAKVAGSARYAGDGAGWEPFYLLIMAHRLRSASIWAHILPRLAKWRVDPATMTAEQVAVLGPELYRIVVGISAYSAGGRAFQDVKGVSVTYPDYNFNALLSTLYNLEHNRGGRT
ncbi:uncharacterized protein LOC62_07G009300 [Vanrija pseudolonga]|uniref:BTB domain-containing protein n=1 Tax=Vanrija pseudolonga TaxID=143232 RepID=A0AAF1BRE8_9TREE|nr:hypothetical protein LOC62_07G009300 [Vanrija pseudolonga]